jgi:hypothetical protein
MELRDLVLLDVGRIHRCLVENKAIVSGNTRIFKSREDADDIRLQRIGYAEYVINVADFLIDNFIYDKDAYYPGSKDEIIEILLRLKFPLDKGSLNFTSILPDQFPNIWCKSEKS